jgi:flagellar biosynthesis protein FlhB
LQYRQGEMNAPKLVAKGADYIAAQIKEIAADHEIPVVEDKPLARTLFFTVDIDQEIPENLFKAVAQVLAYVYQLKKMKTA